MLKFGKVFPPKIKFEVIFHCIGALFPVSFVLLALCHCSCLLPVDSSCLAECKRQSKFRSVNILF